MARVDDRLCQQAGEHQLATRHPRAECPLELDELIESATASIHPEVPMTKTDDTLCTVTTETEVKDARRKLYLCQEIASAESDGFKITFDLSGMAVIATARHEDGREGRVVIRLDSLLSDIADVALEQARTEV